jgi:ferric-dicitrate binding protein FerR (iron transport regulator)
MDPSEARSELWRRYDDGALSAEEVEARLSLLERADGDEPALRAALDGPIPVHRRRSVRRAALAGLLAVVLGGAVVGVVAVASAVSDDEPGADDDVRSQTGPAGGVVVVDGFPGPTVVVGAAEPAPAPPLPPEPATTEPAEVEG